MKDNNSKGMIFGIFPGSNLGDCHRPPADCPDKINQALNILQGSKERHFLVRTYIKFIDAYYEENNSLITNPANFDNLLVGERKIDLVIQYHSSQGDVDGYCKFIKQLIDQYGEFLATVQICEEPNISNDPKLDGFYPRILEAVINGVYTAKKCTKRNNLRNVKIGINTSTLLGSSFLTELTEKGGKKFIRELDYIGLDFFPDVFRPISYEKLGALTKALLSEHRLKNLDSAGLGHLPLIITEHGWPTGPNRSPERQVEVLRTVIDVILRNANELNIIAYIHHSLRDAKSSENGIICQFGLMTDDYTPKPAFYAYRDLIKF